MLLGAFRDSSHILIARRYFVNKQFSSSAHTMNDRAFKFNDMFIDYTTVADVDETFSRKTFSCYFYVFL